MYGDSEKGGCWSSDLCTHAEIPRTKSFNLMQTS